MQKGKLFLIPNSLGNDDLSKVIPASVFDIVNKIDHYIVENIRTAAKFLKLAGLNKPLKELIFYVLNTNSKAGDITGYLDEAVHGKDIGLISEAGLPCIADPGSVIVTMAHQKGIQVVPMSGPSSILMALMASGVNGQSFAFNGYLPIDKQVRFQKFKELENKVKFQNQTQIFIEAPHRNQRLFDEFLEACSDEIILSISKNLTMETEFISSKTIAEWKKIKFSLGKDPVIFILGK